ncbi:MAG: FAD-dependent oxidoreductase [Planctomycetes bacterium]|nr:FAD-dependent oxidoreductase [Planctomycetota bacterium]
MNSPRYIQSPRHDPVWTADVKMPKFSPLQQDVNTDVCIVGAGIAGLSTAYMLALAGRQVVVLDDGTIGGGMTTCTTAHLASVLDVRYFELERVHGQGGVRLAAESHLAAINRIEQITSTENIDCDFERLDGFLFLGPKQDRELLQREMEAATGAGLAVELFSRAPMSGFDTGACLRFPRQGQFHPLKYLAGLAKAVEKYGGRIYTDTHADHIEGGDDTHVMAGQHRIKAGAIVVATNSPINDLVAIHTKQAPYMTYVIGARVPAGSVPRALYWDMEDPYHYVRLCRSRDAEHEILIIGGEDHKTGQADDTLERHARLETWAHGRFSMMENVEFTWAGQVMESMDGLAFIGRNPLDAENVYVVTGDSGMGMTHGTIAGMLLNDLIAGRHNRWAQLYDPSRKPLSAAGSFVQENVNVAMQYFHWLTGSKVSLEDIPNGGGAVVRQGLSKIAVHRDEEGCLHQCSAVCPHLQCIVEWNAAEKSWDCPCHGSRFDKEGHVINGPANQDLARIDSEVEVGHEAP